VPRPDDDGNTVGGVRLPEVEVPLGTSLGWNTRKAEIGNREYLARWDGSFFMFALTKKERLATGDPRPSIEERYESHSNYVSRIAEASQRLTQERLILAEEAQQIVSQAETLVWPPVPTETYPFWEIRR
jgi:hypothetical protein